MRVFSLLACLLTASPLVAQCCTPCVPPPAYFPFANPPVIIYPPVPVLPRVAPAKREGCCSAPKCNCYPCRCTPDSKCDPACPCGKVGVTNGPLFGVDPSKIPQGPTYTVNGKPCSRKEAFHAVTNKNLPDDAHKIRITVIGSNHDSVCKDILSKYGDRFVVQGYTSDHWAVKECGFRAGGNPTVYVQRPDGKVLHRQDDVANLDKALRRVDPSYKPESDPDLRKDPVASAMDFLKNLPVWVYVAGAFLAFYLYSNKQKVS